MKRRGFSFLEILISISLLLLALAFSVGYQQGSQRRVSTRAVAEVVGEGLRNARAEAISSGQPVAFVVPSSQGTCALAQGYYLASAEGEPRITRRVDLSKEYPGVALFVGGIAGDVVDARALPTGLECDGLVFSLPDPKDYALIFTPSGGVLSNGLPHGPGYYRLVVTLGAQYVPANQYEHTGSAPLFELSQACQPCTVSLDSLGQVNVRPNLPGGASVALYTTPLPASLAPLPELGPSSPRYPQLQTIKILPDPAEMPELPANVNALVAKDGFLTLELEARSPTRQALFFRCQDESDNEPGATASAAWEKMDFGNGLWRGRCHWRPPAQASDLSRYRLHCQVRDAQGRLADDIVNSAIELEVRVPKRQLVYHDDGFSTLSSGLLTKEADGTRQLRITQPHLGDNDLLANWSPDGQQLAYIRASITGGSPELRLVAADGSGDRLLQTNVAAAPIGWSPSGLWIAYQGPSTGATDVFKIRADGTLPANLTNTPVWEGTEWNFGRCPNLQWTDSEEFIVATQWRPNDWQKVVKISTNVNTPDVQPLLADPPNMITTAQAVTPNRDNDHTQVIFTRNVHGGEPEFWVASLDGSQAQSLGIKATRGSGGPYTNYEIAPPAVAPGGNRVAILGTVGAVFGLYEVALPPGLPPRLIHDLPPTVQSRLDWIDDARLSYRFELGLERKIKIIEVTGNERTLDATDKVPAGWTTVLP